MNFKILSQLLLLLLAMLPLSAWAGADEQSAPAAAATRFVTLLDAGTVDAAWQEFAPLARMIKSETQWQPLQKSLRTAYGPVEKRSMRGVTLQNRYAMLPDGQYAIVQFDTVFRNKRAAVETIVLGQSQDSRWQVHDYIIN